jgi:hypothetical protein
MSLTFKPREHQLAAIARIICGLPLAAGRSYPFTGADGRNARLITSRSGSSSCAGLISDVWLRRADRLQ